MHIVIVTDQHPDSLGGAQVSIRLQRKHLERAGHTVSVVAPKRLERTQAPANVTSLRRRNSEPRRGVDVGLPAMPITRQRDYGASWPGLRNVKLVQRRLSGLNPPDLVHVQGDFWGAIIGYRIATHYGIPVVHTMHNNLDVGTRAVTGFAPVVFFALRVARRLALGKAPRLAAEETQPTGAWRYLRDLAASAQAVTAPSNHFAQVLRDHGVASSHDGPGIDVVPTGVDDDLLDEIRGEVRPRDPHPTFVWSGRMSPEKRLLPLIEAFALMRETANLVVVGGGLQEEQAANLVREHGLADRVRFTGHLPYEHALRELYRADALVQTSIGFETQGMTPYEATGLGTPTVFCDANIHAELSVAPSWLVADSSVEELARTLDTAATELTVEAGPRLRVPELLAAEVAQSNRTEQMLRVYERVLSS